MACHGAKAPLLLRIPYLHETFVCADSDVGPALNPGDGSNDVVLEVTEFVNPTCS